MDAPSLPDFLTHFERVRARTRRVVALIPPDRIEWAYKPGAMTPGDLVRHLAVTERLMWAETVMGRPSLYVSHGRELADGKAATVAFLNHMHAEAMAIFGALTPEQFLAPCLTPGNAEMAAWKWLRAMLEHEIHHRGQLYMMLSLLGVETPPLFGLTSEELRAKAGG